MPVAAVARPSSGATSASDSEVAGELSGPVSTWLTISPASQKAAAPASQR